jgi:ankyrin repeat protein
LEQLKIALIAICTVFAFQLKANTCGDLCSAVWWANKPSIADVRSKIEINKRNVHSKGYRKRSALHMASLFGDAQKVQLLLDFEADVMARTMYGYTPLHRAKTVEIAKTLINAGAEIDAKSDSGKTPLFKAIENISKGREKELIKFLISSGANVNSKEKGWYNNTPLHLAAEAGNLDILITLIEGGAIIDMQNDSGYTAAHFAGTFGNTKVLSALFALGADREIKATDGKTALDLLTENRKNPNKLLAIIARETRLFQKSYKKNKSSNINNSQSQKAATLSKTQKSELSVTNSKCGNLCNSDWWWTATTTDLKNELKRGSSVLAINETNGRSPLEGAINSSPASYKELLRLGADINAKRPNYGTTPLHYAAAVNFEKLKLLLEFGADFNAQDKNLSTPLHFTGYYNYSSKIDDLTGRGAKLLLKFGADPNVKNRDGETPLHFASKITKNPGIIRNLIAAGADVNAMNNEGNTPLHLTFNRHYPNDNMDILLSLGADINASNFNGDTPLHLTFKASTAAYKELIKFGANVNASNFNGDTPLHIAAKIKRKKYKPSQKISLLLEAGANPLIKNIDGNTPLHLISFNQNGDTYIKQSIDILLQSGSDLLSKNSSGYTPLHLAVGHCKLNAAKALIEAGANPLIQSNNGDTPLHILISGIISDMKEKCFYKKQSKIIKLLIEAGAKVNLKNKNGKSPWSLAQEQDFNNTTVYNLLDQARSR